jgi:hypothetical protein
MIKHKPNDILNIVYNLLSIGSLCSLFIYPCNGIEYSSCNKLWGVTQDANGKMLYKVGMYMCIEDPYKIYKNMQSISAMPVNETISSISSNSSNNISGLLETTTISPKPNNNLTHIANLNNLSVSNLTYNNKSQNINPTVNFTTDTSTHIPIQTTEVPYTTQPPNIITETPNVSSNIKPPISKELNNENNTDGDNNTNLNLNSLRSAKNVSENNTNDILNIVLIVVCVCIVNVGVCSYLYLRYRKIKHLNSKVEDEKSKHPLPPPPPPPTVNNFQPSKNKSKLQRGVNMILPKKTINSHLKVDTTKSSRDLKLNHKALTPNTRKIFDSSVVSMQSWYEDTFKNELGYNSKDAPQPPSKKAETMKPPLKATVSYKNGEFKLKNNVKRLINKKEQEIQKFDKNKRTFAQ